MKQYQFKTTSSNNFGNNALPTFDYSPNLKIDTNYGQKQAHGTVTQSQRLNLNSTEKNNVTSSGQTNNNINQMRNKLNELLKQT